jgi:hypothetical protein
MKAVRALLLASIAVAVAFGLWQTMAAEAQPPAKEEIRVTVNECKSCHVSAQAEGAKVFVEKYKSNEFIRLDESAIWSDHDPHNKAFAVLKTPLGQQMAGQLKYDVTKDARCLSCHAIDAYPAKAVPTERYIARDDIGIGCSACHGLKREWQTEHYSEDNTGTKVPWRTYAVDVKAKAGLTNLRDPHVKANLCVSCHVGNAAEGKVITHDMYAAGHPPLLPFELATFMADEPQHWGSPFDPQLKKYFDSINSKTALDVFSYHQNEGGDGFSARNIAVGAIAALDAEAKLLADASEHAKDGNLDYARFDCYACHHDLKLPSDRQKRGYDGPPGRPPLKAWNGALASVVAEHAAKSGNEAIAKLAKEFPAKWKATQQAAYAKPYGDPAAMKKAAGELSAWCNAFLAALKANAVYSTESAKALQNQFRDAALSDKYIADPEAVMALVWAYRGIDRWQYAESEDWKHINEAIPASVREASQLKAKPPVTVGQLLKDRMERFNKYDAAKFRKVFPPAQLPAP